MAKGHVTDQDLESGIRSLGGLGGIAGGGARRDSPFGSDFARKAVPEAAPEPPAAQADAARAVELRPAKEVVAAPPVAGSPLPEVKSPPPVRVPADPKPRAREAPKPVPTLPEIPARKSDSFTERVTLQMSPDMRDELNLLAAKLQRRKFDKSERITANTIMRVAIRIVLDEVDFGTGDIANSETDLLRIARKKLVGS